MKCAKNPVEVNGMINAHLKDAVGLIQFLYFMENEVNMFLFMTKLQLNYLEIAQPNSFSWKAFVLIQILLYFFGSNYIITPKLTCQKTKETVFQNSFKHLLFICMNRSVANI